VIVFHDGRKRSKASNTLTFNLVSGTEKKTKRTGSSRDCRNGQLPYIVLQLRRNAGPEQKDANLPVRTV
jgi:hypothetical protein